MSLLDKKDEWIFCYWDDCLFINEVNKTKYEKSENSTGGEESPNTGEATGEVLCRDTDCNS